MSKTPILYDYFVHPISEDESGAYKAIIPAFDNAVVYGKTLSELEEGIRFTISSEISDRKKRKNRFLCLKKKLSSAGKYF